MSLKGLFGNYVASRVLNKKMETAAGLRAQGSGSKVRSSKVQRFGLVSRYCLETNEII